MNLRREGQSLSASAAEDEKQRHNSPWDGDEEVDPLVVVQGLELERLDMPCPLGHSLAADRHARERRARRDDGRSSSTSEEAARTRDADGREGGTESRADNGCEKSCGQADDESTACEQAGSVLSPARVTTGQLTERRQTHHHITMLLALLLPLH